MSPAVAADLPAIRALIADAIRTNVARSDDEARFLIDDIDHSLVGWQSGPGDAIHWKALREDRIAGVILVKDYWNLVNLFVAPACQRQGIGRALLTVALATCRDRCPYPALRVNSSTVAVGFYQRQGFVPNGDPRDRPGGCVPLRYEWPRV